MVPHESNRNQNLCAYVWCLFFTAFVKEKWSISRSNSNLYGDCIVYDNRNDRDEAPKHLQNCFFSEKYVNNSIMHTFYKGRFKEWLTRPARSPDLCPIDFRHRQFLEEKTVQINNYNTKIKKNLIIFKFLFRRIGFICRTNLKNQSSYFNFQNYKLHFIRGYFVLGKPKFSCDRING